MLLAALVSSRRLQGHKSMRLFLRDHRESASAAEAACLRGAEIKMMGEGHEVEVAGEF